MLVLNVADGRLVAKLAGPARRVAFLPDGDHLLVHLVGHPAGFPAPWSLEHRAEQAGGRFFFGR